MAGRLEDDLGPVLSRKDSASALAADLGSLPLRAQKVPQPDANYVDPGPEPFVCGSCRFMVHGKESDLCQIVEGKIHATGACRFFAHSEDARADAIEHPNEPSDTADEEEEVSA